MMREDPIPMDKWGKDHWSTLAYLETVCVEKQEFEVVTNPHMRSKRRHFRILAQETHTDPCAIPMSREHGTLLFDGSMVENHDDWDCLGDMIGAGLIFPTSDCHGEVGPYSRLKLSEAGQKMAAALRRHKSAGGNFGNFKP